MIGAKYAPLHPLSKVNFKHKRWGYDKKYIDHSYIFFTKIERSNFIIQPEQRWFK